MDNGACSDSPGPQTLYVGNQSNWYAVSDQPNIGGQVETYPNTEIRRRRRGQWLRSRHRPNHLIQLRHVHLLRSLPSAGTWDAGYDLWTGNWTNETMIWNQWAGSPPYWAGVMMFFRDSQVSSGSVDLLAAFQWEVAHGYAGAGDIPTQFEYGVEICATNGTETFP